MLSLLRKCRLCFRDPARVRAGDVAYNGALVAWFRCVIALPLPGRQQQSAGEVAQGWIGITTGVGGKELILAGVPPRSGHRRIPRAWSPTGCGERVRKIGAVKR
jgi:hypothetical protein